MQHVFTPAHCLFTGFNWINSKKSLFVAHANCKLIVAFSFKVFPFSHHYSYAACAPFTFQFRSVWPPIIGFCLDTLTWLFRYRTRAFIIIIILFYPLWIVNNGHSLTRLIYAHEPIIFRTQLKMRTQRNSIVVAFANSHTKKKSYSVFPFRFTFRRIINLYLFFFFFFCFWFNEYVSFSFWIFATVKWYANYMVHRVEWICRNREQKKSTRSKPTPFENSSRKRVAHSVCWLVHFVVFRLRINFPNNSLWLQLQWMWVCGWTTRDHFFVSAVKILGITDRRL